MTLTKSDIKSRIDKTLIHMMASLGLPIEEFMLVPGVKDLMKLSVDISEEIHGVRQEEDRGHRVGHDRDKA